MKARSMWSKNPHWMLFPRERGTELRLIFWVIDTAKMFTGFVILAIDQSWPGTSNNIVWTKYHPTKANGGWAIINKLLSSVTISLS